MREARHKALLRKAISACVAAIEIYNKPVMPHRDETFAMLAVNAWELLLKARLVKEAKNQLRAIQVLEPVPGREGRPTRKKRVKRNRSGNAETISLGQAARRVRELPKLKLDPACEANLWSLVEIRDNAVHFVLDDPEMGRRAHEACCACIRNFAAAAAEWFDHDLGEHRFMILPLSFDGAAGPALAVSSRRSRQAANLMAFLDRAGDDHPASDGKSYAAAVRVETRIVGSRNRDAVPLRLVGGGGAPAVALTDEQIAENWPYDYSAFVKRVVACVPGLKQNAPFHEAVRTIKVDPRLVHRRHLHPGNHKSQKKEFFSDAAIEAAVRALKVAPLL